MNNTLSDKNRKHLDDLISAAEKRTNSQIVLALIQRSDVYAEIPWKAFALGASIAGLMFFILHLILIDWYPVISALLAITGTLGTGFLFAILTLFLPAFAKLFLSDSRIDTEVKQYADSLFLSREIFATSNRSGILLMVSQFERKVVILPDTGLQKVLTADVLQNIISAMAPFLKRGEISQAFETGIEQISRLLENKVSSSGENELPDEIIEEDGV